jgi:hypothetical protein
MTARAASRWLSAGAIAVSVLAAGTGACSAQEEAKMTQWPQDKPLARLSITDRTAEPLLKAEKPWEDFIVNYARVLRIGKTWHMWYNSYDHTYKHDQDAYLCYARSDDGVRWTKPDLGLYDYAGSKDSNIIAKGICVPGVFLDDSAGPEERFKIVWLRFQDSKMQTYGGVSADGLHWKWTGRLLADNSDTDNVCFRDGGVYRMYVRMWSPAPHRRQVGYTESATFGAFPSPRVILEADKDDPADMDFYNSAATKLMPGLYVMFPGAFYRGSQNVIPHAALGRDGVNFRRVGRKPVLELGKGFDSRCIYVAGGAIPAERPGEYWFYYLGTGVGHDETWPNKVRYGGGIGRFKLRLDVAEPAPATSTPRPPGPGTPR